MTLPVLVTPPTDEPLTLEEAKQHCRIEAAVTEDDALVEAYIGAAVDQLQRELDFYLAEQTWKQSFRTFDCVRIWQRPVAEVVSVAYFDADDEEQTLDDAEYRFESGALGSKLVLAGSSWPSLASRTDAVTVTYKLGVATADIPPALKAALMLHVGFLYANRESSSDTAIRPTGAYDALVWPFRRLAV